MCIFIAALTLLIPLACPAAASHVILTGKDLPHLLGKPIASIRVLDMGGKAIPFQIDEVTDDGEYVLDKGEMPNTENGTGLLDEGDEIVFLWDDAGNPPESSKNPDPAGISDSIDNNGGNDNINGKNSIDGLVVFSRGSASRAVIIRLDKSIPLSTKKYIDYDHAAQRVVTPFYYADFAKDRFHFLRAGVRDFRSGKFIDLTNELRVEILLKTLFGLIPVRYTEDNIVCLVRRYKAGPIRLVRRGDFHLNLGLGVKGSRAAVDQICYPQAVQVPVYVHLPIRFRALFGQAYIEMTPVVREAGRAFTFSAPSAGAAFPVGGADIDTLCEALPAGRMFTLLNGATGYGWLLNTTMDPAHLGGSGFVMRRPPPGRAGIAECGFRLTVRDVPRGSYYITNWVVFPGGRDGDARRLGEAVNLPVRVKR